MDRRRVWVNGPVIVGAGPSGLAVGSSLRARGVPFVILERAECIASLWQNRTYDRLRLHLPKSFCQLPNLPFPSSFPTYPSRKQFISYLESYCEKFSLNPNFNEPVISAEFNQTSGLWQVSTSKAEYLCRWLVAATGENSQPLIPEIEGLGDFPGEVIHACDYKSGESFSKKKVLVVGCGNSGMEISLDLAHHGASPLMVVRNSVHVLPREVLGWSTFELAMRMLTWLPLKLVDRILLVISWLAMGDLGKLGLRRPEKGPLETKRAAGKTPVLDVGAVEKIKAGEIAVVPGILTFCGSKVELEDGGEEEIDAVVLATGYRSNLPVWLKERELVGDGGFPRGWRGGLGFYAVGFSRSGLAGAALEAGMVAEEVDGLWREQTGQARRASFSL